MEAKSTRRRWTYAEFARLPSEGSKRHEIIDGKLYVTLSPSTSPRDRGIKLERYRHFGVPEYWIVDAEPETVEV